MANSLPADALIPRTPEQLSFVHGLLATGQAVHLAPGESLPPGATHEIVGRTDLGDPIVVRRRFA